MSLIFISLCLVSIVVQAQKLTVYNANNMLNSFGFEIAMDGTMDKWIIDQPGNMVFQPKDKSYIYTNFFCQDFSKYNGVEIVMTAPAGSEFTFAFQSSNNGCSSKGSAYTQNTKKFVQFDGTRKTFRIPFEWFTIFDPRSVWAITLSGFNNIGKDYVLHSISFDIGAGAPRSCPFFQDSPVFETFNNVDNWMDDSQRGGGPQHYHIEGNTLVFDSPAISDVRPKMKLKGRTFKGPGRHQWRAYVPMRKAGDWASVGAFLYFDDYHEVDFEVGYGATNVRAAAEAKDNQVIAYMTTQAIDGGSWITTDGSQVAIDGDAWHDFTIDLNLDITGTQYIVHWWIDGKLMKSSGHAWGPNDVGNGFTSHVSMENLWWLAIGYLSAPGFPDTPFVPIPRTVPHGSLTPETRNRGYFDTYRYTPMASCAQIFGPPESIVGDAEIDPIVIDDDEEEFIPGYMIPENYCKQQPSINNLKEVNKISPECAPFKVVRLMIDNLKIYTDMYYRMARTKNFDEHFNAYRDHVRDTIKQDIFDFVIDRGNEYFNCDGPNTCPTRRQISEGFMARYEFKNEVAKTAFYTKILEEKKVEGYMINPTGNYFKKNTACRNMPPRNPLPGNGGGWIPGEPNECPSDITMENVPVFSGQLRMDNPKDELAPLAKNITGSINQVDIGNYNSVVKALILPYILFNDAVDNMSVIYNIGANLIHAKNMQIAMGVIALVSIALPILGVGAAMVESLATIAYLANLAGVALDVVMVAIGIVDGIINFKQDGGLSLAMGLFGLLGAAPAFTSVRPNIAKAAKAYDSVSPHLPKIYGPKVSARIKEIETAGLSRTCRA